MKYSLKQILCLFIIFSVQELFSQTIDQKLIVYSNSQTIGGDFVVDVQVQGTSLTAANTLGSATIDVTYDNSKISFQSADTWPFGPADGYTRSATDIGTFIRVGVTGGGVGPGYSTVGFDIGSSYVTWVRLHFQILSGGVTSLGISSGSNQIGLFENHANNPQTGVINNQALSTPVVITDEPTPVELSAFSAKVNGSNVELLWKTATEVNNFGFNIERSLNEGEAGSWKKVGFVAGNGNSNSPKSYSFTDNNLIGGSKFSYRLKQIDNDGKYQYSKEVEVKVIPKQYALYQNYPNPFNPTTKIKFDLPEASKVRIDIYNILGEKVGTLLNETKEAGYHQVEFNGGNLASGTYIYRIEASGSGQSFVQTKKMLLLK